MVFIAGRRLLCVGQPQQQAVQQQREAEVDDSNFEAELEKAKPHLVVIFFYMSHCPHCRRLMPSVQKLNRQTPHMRLLKCDLMRSPRVRQYLNVESAPSTFIMKGGQWAERLDGGMPDDEFEAAIAKQI